MYKFNPTGEVEKPKRKDEEPKPKDAYLDWGAVARDKEPHLVFSPTAWAKIQYFQDNENGVEISGFGISHEDNLLVIEDFILVPQESNAAHVELDDKGIMNLVMDMAEEDIRPERCSRIWIHTHPGMSPSPSGNDNTTFKKSFKSCNWSIMCIVSSDQSYARLQLNKPFELETKIKVKVDWSIPLEPIDYGKLAEEYKEKVRPHSFIYSSNYKYGGWHHYSSSPSLLNESFIMEGHECGYCGAFYDADDDDEGLCPECADFVLGTEVSI